MKHVIYSLVFFTQISLAQVGINTTSPDNSSVLDIEATDKGLLIPRIALANITTTMLDGVNTAATGLLIYNTNAAVVGGNGVGFYLFNGTAWEKLTTTADAATGDADFFEEGTTAAPDDINDDLYTLGNLAIGKSNATYPLDINVQSGTGIFANIANSQTGIVQGVWVNANGDALGQRWAFRTTLSGGSDNYARRGLINSITTGGSGLKAGVDTYIDNEDEGITYGIKNELISSSASATYGNYNYIRGTGSGEKYGIFSNILATAGGNHVGVYSSATKGGSFAGYFRGSLAVGTSLPFGGTPNYYVFPSTRGTNGQIMQTDGSGNVNWVDASTVGSEDADFLEVGTGTAPNAITDNMYTQGALAIGDTSNDESRLNITAGASENYNNGLKIDLASGTNSGFLLRGIDVEINSDVSASPTNVSGIEVENNSNAAVKAGIISTVNNVGGGSGKWNLLLNTSNQSTSTGNITGIWNTVSVGGGSGTQFGVRQRLLDTGGNSSGTLYGYNSDVLNGGSGPSIGFYSLIQTNNSSNAIAFDALHTGNSGTGNKYGLRAIIPTTVGGTNQYGVYSEVLRSGSNTFAGYFLGNVSIGTTSSNNYILPASRGTNGQVMQTDGAGNVSWANSSSFWSRTGTVLDVANTGDDITFSSDQSTISFPITSGTPPAMIHMFGGGTANSDRMVFAHSSTFSNWGLMYRDANDSFRFLNNGSDRVVINLGSGNPLVVNGTAEATDFQSATTTYPDYVFESYFEGSSNINPNYQFQDLKVVAEFIQKKGHLPGVKSFAEVKQQGMTINLGETSVKNLEKIEELFLYVIELEKENRQLKETLKKQEERLQKIESFIQNQ